MKGLILKDLFLIKGNIKMVLVVLLGFGIMLVNNMTSISFFLPFFSTMLCISTFSYDEYNKWDAYVICLPNGRKNSVSAKYIVTLILIIISFIISIGLVWIIPLAKETTTASNDIYTLIGGISGVLLMVIVMYPLLYKFGAEKGRLILFVLILAVAIIGGSLLNNISIDSFKWLESISSSVLITSGSIILGILLYASYKLSLNIYSKKEF
ncbi:MAG: ABC-2 transporter permease [bacterium]|nr:ABC-2 transporter permease [bacterium]